MDVCHSIIPWRFLYLSYFRKKESVGECIFRWHEMIQLDANTWQDLYIFNDWNSFNLLFFLHKPLLKTIKPHPIVCSSCFVIIFSWQPLFLAWEEIISNRYPPSSIAAPSGIHDDLYWEYCAMQRLQYHSHYYSTQTSVCSALSNIFQYLYMSFISDVELECLVRSLPVRWNLWRQFSYCCMSFSFLTLLNKDQSTDRLSWQPAQRVKQFLSQVQTYEVIRVAVLVILWVYLLVAIFFASFCSRHLQFLQTHAFHMWQGHAGVFMSGIRVQWLIIFVVL